MKYHVPLARKRTLLPAVDPCRNIAIAAIIEELLTEEPVAVFVTGHATLEFNEEKEENNE